MFYNRQRIFWKKLIYIFILLFLKRFLNAHNKYVYTMRSIIKLEHVFIVSNQQ